MQNYKDFAYLQGFRRIFLTEFYFWVALKKTNETFRQKKIINKAIKICRACDNLI